MKPEPQISENFQPQRNFQIPGASVIVQSEDDPMPIEQLLAIVFQIAGSNPDCKVHFYVKVEG
jgi:hypothetical protein